MDSEDKKTGRVIDPYGQSFFLYADISRVLPGVPFIIDTGADISLLPQIIYDRMEEDEKPKLEKHQHSVFCGNNQSIRIAGIVIMTIKIQNIDYEAAFHISPDIPKGIIGNDFLERNEGDIQVGRRKVMLNGRLIKIYDSRGVPLHHRVVAARTMMIPPGSRWVVPGVIKGKGLLDEQPFLVEGAKSMANKNGILTARIISTHNNYRMRLEVHNFTDETQRVNKDATMGILQKLHTILPWSGCKAASDKHNEVTTTDEEQKSTEHNKIESNEITQAEQTTGQTVQKNDEAAARNITRAKALPQRRATARRKRKQSRSQRSRQNAHGDVQHDGVQQNVQREARITDGIPQNAQQETKIFSTQQKAQDGGKMYNTTKNAASTRNKPSSYTKWLLKGNNNTPSTKKLSVNMVRCAWDEDEDDEMPGLVDVDQQEDNDVAAQIMETEMNEAQVQTDETTETVPDLVEIYADSEYEDSDQEEEMTTEDYEKQLEEQVDGHQKYMADAAADKEPSDIYVRYLFRDRVRSESDFWTDSGENVWTCADATYPFATLPNYSVEDLPEHMRPIYTKYVGSIDNEWDKFAFLLLLKEYQDAFATNPYDLGRTNIEYHHIDTGNNPPFKHKPRRLPLAQQEEMRAQVQKMADIGIIRPSNSNYASNVLLVGKKDNTWRMCIDYRALNANTVNKDPYLIPRIDDTLDALQGAKYFCTLDLAQGYHQVELSESSKPKTAFITPQMTPSLWEFTCMPFGITGGPATFQRIMDRLLVGMAYKIALAYLDDVIVYGATVRQVMDRLSRVFDRIRKAGLKLKPKKCTFFERETLYLGHVVSERGVKCDPAKIDKVKDWPRPKNGKDCLKFAGFCNYYNRFIKDFSALARPLYALGPKRVKFSWGEMEETSFQALKAALTSAPVMAYPTPNGRWILDTDASHFAIGGVLSQMQSDENGEEQEKVIAYGSKSLQGRQQRYCTRRRELLAIVHFVKAFRPYLYGKFVTIRTDHASLRYLKTLNNPDDQFARWIEVLEETYYTIEIRKGKDHGNADGMSRIPTEACEGNKCICIGVDEMERKGEVTDDYRIQSAAFDDEEGVEIADELDSDDDEATKPAPSTLKNTAEDKDDGRKLTVNALNFTKKWTATEVAADQQEDPDIQLLYECKRDHRLKPDQSEINPLSPAAKMYFHDWKRIKLMENKVLYRLWEDEEGIETRYQMILPAKHREAMFRQLHDAINAAHMGRRRTFEKLQRKYFWYQMEGDVRRWIQACPICQRRKPTHKPPRAPLKPFLVGMPCEQIAMDVIDHLPTTVSGNKCVLTIVDHFSKYAKAIALPNQTAKTVADALMRHWISIFGTPFNIHTDQGRNFESGLIREMCELLKIDKSRTTAYHPSGNGQCERQNSTIMNIVHTYARKDPTNWDVSLHVALMGYNSTCHDATGVEPNKLMLGRSITMPADLMMPQDPSVHPRTINEHVAKIERDLRWSFQVARDHLRKRAEATKRYYDRHTHLNKYETGDAVKLRVCRRGPGMKMVDKYEGPYFVIDQLGDVTFRVARNKHAKPKVLHHDMMIPYHLSSEEKKQNLQWVFDKSRENHNRRNPSVGTQTIIVIEPDSDAVGQEELEELEYRNDIEYTAERGDTICISRPENRARKEWIKKDRQEALKLMDDFFGGQEFIPSYSSESEYSDEENVELRAVEEKWKNGEDDNMPIAEEEMIDNKPKLSALEKIQQLRRSRPTGDSESMEYLLVQPNYSMDLPDHLWKKIALEVDFTQVNMLDDGHVQLRDGVLELTKEDWRSGAVCKLAADMASFGVKTVATNCLTIIVDNDDEGMTLPEGIMSSKGTKRAVTTQSVQTDIWLTEENPWGKADPDVRAQLYDTRKKLYHRDLAMLDWSRMKNCYACKNLVCGPHSEDKLPYGSCTDLDRTFIDPAEHDNSMTPTVHGEREMLIPARQMSRAAQTDVNLFPFEHNTAFFDQMLQRLQGKILPVGVREVKDQPRGFSDNTTLRDLTKGTGREIGFEPTFLDSIKLCTEDSIAKERPERGPCVEDEPQVRYNLRNRDIVYRDTIRTPSAKDSLDIKPTKRAKRIPKKENFYQHDPFEEDDSDCFVGCYHCIEKRQTKEVQLQTKVQIDIILPSDQVEQSDV